MFDVTSRLIRSGQSDHPSRRILSQSDVLEQHDYLAPFCQPSCPSVTRISFSSDTGRNPRLTGCLFLAYYDRPRKPGEYSAGPNDGKWPTRSHTGARPEKTCLSTHRRLSKGHRILQYNLTHFTT